ncbi:YqeB family protein [Couchioplanes azureus]|uniref:YqeB family protein n=1 Tax=Couchioplanes caeruleus TaxID=56438 RepID=UPI00167115DE|nr:hypothetical protein [Couchioplanes caeruleus]GGQ55602.1 hypothetical protein GCM10010166_26110 [Couchioplanes caeruleus subsp. azureus]
MIEDRTVATPVWVRAAVWLALPAVGAGVGWVVRQLLDWIVRIPFVPMRDALEWAAEAPDPQATFVALALGAALGLVLAYYVDRESLTVQAAGTEVVLTRPGVRRTVPRGEITAAYRDRDELVLLGRAGQELAREPCHLAPRRLATLFGSTWHDRDPYADAYRRWVPGLPELPAEAEAMLKARQKALDKGDTDEAQELRTELSRLGFVLRDERKRQHFRRTG